MGQLKLISTAQNNNINGCGVSHVCRIKINNN